MIRTVIISIAAAILSAAPLTAQPKIGVYPGILDGDQAIARVNQYQEWLNRPMDYIVSFVPGDTWRHITGSDGSGLQWWIWQYDSPVPQTTRDKMVISISMLPGNSDRATWTGSHANGARGDYNGNWTAVANKLINAGYGKCIIRVGWEFTGDWYPWRVYDGMQNDYIRHWQNLVTQFKNEQQRLQPTATSRFKFCWNPTSGWLKFNPMSFYPGNDYVDYIGLDVYDVSELWFGSAAYQDGTMSDGMKLSNRTNAWLQQKQWDKYNLDWFVGQARRTDINKPLCIPEWGCDRASWGFHYRKGGIDDPVFINSFTDWMNNSYNKIAWASYFEFGTGDGTTQRNHSLRFSNQFPSARTAMWNRWHR